MWTKSFSRYTRILLVSAAVIIGAQISISLFESDFRVSIGIFGIFMSLILFGKYPVLPVTVISALCVFFSRTLMHSLWQLESTELFSGNVFLSGLRSPFFPLLP